MARPKDDLVEKTRVRAVKHVAFHQGVQFNGKVYSSLNSDVHAKHDVEMYVLAGGMLQVLMDTGSGKGVQEWLIGSGMWHYALTEKLEDSVE